MIKNQRGWRTLGEQGPQNQLSRSHKNSQRLKQQAQCLRGSVPGPLYMYCNFQLSNSNGTPEHVKKSVFDSCACS